MSTTSIKKLLAQEIKSILYRTNADGKREEIEDPSIEDAIVLSGSFNPLHGGHVLLCKQATFQAGAQTTIFELSVQVADKGGIEEETLLRRIKQFETIKETLLVTTSPLFYQKASHV